MEMPSPEGVIIRYTRQLVVRYLRVICEEFGEADVSKILRQVIEDWLEEAEWSPRTRKNYLVT
jgi:hypothetical protein